MKEFKIIPTVKQDGTQFYHLNYYEDKELVLTTTYTSKELLEALAEELDIIDGEGIM